MNDFAVFILSNRRPNAVVTVNTLKKHGYTGKVYILVDDQDPTGAQYEEKYPGQVIVFNKARSAKLFDRGDNFNDFRSTNYARNALWLIAKDLGLKHFLQLDDDYTSFAYRFDKGMNYVHKPHRKLDELFKTLVDFFEVSGAKCIAIAQGGDFIGGKDGTNPYTKRVQLLRKLMNFYICSTERPFTFLGRLNEDVNTYARCASQGLLFFTLNQVSLEQKQTQSNSGGMTDVYKDSGTYVKSFYSVMFQPSSVKVRVLATQNQRIHHAVHWRYTAPKILSEELKRK